MTRKILKTSLFTIFVFCILTAINVCAKELPINKISTSTDIKGTTVGSNITVTFKKKITKGNKIKKIKLTRNGKSEKIKTSIRGTKLIVNPVKKLKYSSKYKLTIPLGAVKESKGKATNGNRVYIFSTTQKKLNIKQIIKKNIDSCVKIELFDARGDSFAEASGFIINHKNENLVVTNYHVLEDAYSAVVITENQGYFDLIEVYNYNKEKDLAVFRVANSAELNNLVCGKAVSCEVGDVVYGITSPLGMKNTVATGIISRMEYDWEVGKEFQVSVPIDHGSSGGALFNEYGEVIGVLYAGMDSYAVINFAIPINNLKKLLETDKAISLVNMWKS